MRAVIALALVLAACGGVAAPAGPAAASPSATVRASQRTPTPIPTLNIFQLMGGAPATTVFALGARIRAVRLLDHFVKYEIAVERGAQLLVTTDGTRLVVADQPGSGVRLRVFDVAAGGELASQADDGVPAMLVAGRGRGALAEDANGRLLVLKVDGRSAWVDAYDGASLRLVARRLVEAVPDGNEPAPCAERLVVAGSRILLVCLRNGIATVATPGGGAPVRVRLAPGEIAGAVAVSGGDSVVAVTPAGQAYRWRRADLEVEPYGTAAGSGPVPRDGIAVAEDQVVVARGGDTPSVQILPSVGASRPLPVPAAPTGGLLASSPFAYFTSAGALYHVDLNTGNVERMTGGFENDAVPAALVAR